MNLVLASPPGRSRRAPVQGDIIFRRDARAHDHRGHGVFRTRRILEGGVVRCKVCGALYGYEGAPSLRSNRCGGVDLVVLVRGRLCAILPTGVMGSPRTEA